MKRKNREVRNWFSQCAAFCMALALALTCVGCGGGGPVRQAEPVDNPPSETAQPVAETPSGTAQAAPETPSGTAQPVAEAQPMEQLGGNAAPEPRMDPDMGGPNGTVDMVDEYHVALVMDTSGSISEAVSDPRAVLWAPCMFLDTMFISDAQGEDRSGIPNAKVGIYWYNDGKPHSMYEKGTMQTLTKVENVEVLKNYIRNEVRVTPGSGDSALAETLELALATLASNRSANSVKTFEQEIESQWMNEGDMVALPETDKLRMGVKEKEMILLFTDGYTRYSPDDSGELPYSFDAKSSDTIKKAVQTATDMGIEIYIIGLDTSGKPNPEESAMGGSWKAFMELANATQMSVGTVPMQPAPGMGGGQPGQPGMEGGQPGQPGMEGGQPGQPGMEGGQPGQPGMEGGQPGQPGMEGGQPGGPEMADSLSGVFDGVNYCLCETVKALQAAYVKITGAMVLQGSGAEPIKDRSQGRDNMWEYNVKVSDAGNSAIVFFLLSDNLSRLSLRHYPDGASEPDQEYVSWPLEQRHNPLDTYHQEIILDNGETVKRDNWWVIHNYDNLPSQKVRCPFYVDCATIAVIEPELGRWSIEAQGDEPEAWSVQIGGIKFRLGMEQNPDSPQKGVIRIWADVGQRSMEQAFYNAILSKCSCTVFLDNGEGKPEPIVSSQGQQPQPERLYYKNVGLGYDEENRCLKGEFIAPIPGSYKVEFSMQSSSIDYKTETDFLRIWPTAASIEPLSFQRVSETKSYRPRFMEWSGIPLRIVEGTAFCDLLEIEEDGDSLRLRSVRDGVGVLSMDVEFYNERGGEGSGGYRWHIECPVGVMEDTSLSDAATPQYVGRVLGEGDGGVVNVRNSGGALDLTIKITVAIIALFVAGGLLLAALSRRKSRL